MDWLTFIAEIAKALAWPIAGTVIALVFRGELKTLLTRVKKGKLGPAEFEFEQGVREIRQELPPNLPRIEHQVPPVVSRQSSQQEMRSLVLEAWLAVEQAMNALALKHNVYNALAAPNSASNANGLAKLGVIEPWVLNIYRDLRRLRNQATHDVAFEPSEESVLAFMQTAGELQAVLEGLRNAP